MIVTQKILSMAEGAVSVGSGQLIGASLIEVDREGVGINEKTIVMPWGSRDYVFNPVHGFIAFNPSEPGGPGGEKVYILYKKY